MAAWRGQSQKEDFKEIFNTRGAAAPRGSNHQHSTPWAKHPQPLHGGDSAAAAAAAPPPSTSHIALPPSTDIARTSAPSQHPQTPMQADDPDIQHIDHHV